MGKDLFSPGTTVRPSRTPEARRRRPAFDKGKRGVGMEWKGEGIKKKDVEEEGSHRAEDHDDVRKRKKGISFRQKRGRNRIGGTSKVDQTERDFSRRNIGTHVACVPSLRPRAHRGVRQVVGGSELGLEGPVAGGVAPQGDADLLQDQGVLRS